LQQQERVELEPPEQGRGLLIPEGRRPEEDRGDAALLPSTFRK
jgi:hypothetical protein